MSFNDIDEAAILDETSRVSALDLYEDLLITDEKQGTSLTIHEVNYEKQQLEEQNRLLRLQLAQATSSLKTVSEQNHSLKENFTSLLETAKVELERKNKVINRLSGKPSMSTPTSNRLINRQKKSQNFSSVSLKGRRINDTELAEIAKQNSKRNTNNSKKSTGDLTHIKKRLPEEEDNKKVNTTKSSTTNFKNPTPTTLNSQVNNFTHKEKTLNINPAFDLNKSNSKKIEISTEKNIKNTTAKDVAQSLPKPTNGFLHKSLKRDHSKPPHFPEKLTLTPKFTTSSADEISSVENWSANMLNKSDKYKDCNSTLRKTNEGFSNKNLSLVSKGCNNEEQSQQTAMNCLLKINQQKPNKNCTTSELNLKLKSSDEPKNKLVNQITENMETKAKEQSVNIKSSIPEKSTSKTMSDVCKKSLALNNGNPEPAEKVIPEEIMKHIPATKSINSLPINKKRDSSSLEKEKSKPKTMSTKTHNSMDLYFKSQASFDTAKQKSNKVNPTNNPVKFSTEKDYLSSFRQENEASKCHYDMDKNHVPSNNSSTNRDTKTTDQKKHQSTKHDHHYNHNDKGVNGSVYDKKDQLSSDKDLRKRLSSRDRKSSRDRRSSRDRDYRSSRDKKYSRDYSSLSSSKSSRSSHSELSSKDRDFSRNRLSSRDKTSSRDRLSSRDHSSVRHDNHKRRTPDRYNKSQNRPECEKRSKLSTDKRSKQFTKQDKEHRDFEKRQPKFYMIDRNNKSKQLPMPCDLMGYDKTDPLNLRHDVIDSDVSITSKRSKSPIKQSRHNSQLLNSHHNNSSKSDRKEIKSCDVNNTTLSDKIIQNGKKPAPPQPVFNKTATNQDNQKSLMDNNNLKGTNSVLNLGNKKRKQSIDKGKSEYTTYNNLKKNANPHNPRIFEINKQSTPLIHKNNNQIEEKEIMLPINKPQQNATEVFDLPGFGILDQLDFDEDSQSQIFLHSKSSNNIQIPKPITSTKQTFVPSIPPSLCNNTPKNSIIEPAVKKKKIDEMSSVCDFKNSSIRPSINLNNEHKSPTKTGLPKILRRSPRIVKKQTTSLLNNNSDTFHKRKIIDSDAPLLSDKKRRLSNEASCSLPSKSYKTTNRVEKNTSDAISDCLLNSVSVNLGKKVSTSSYVFPSRSNNLSTSNINSKQAGEIEKKSLANLMSKYLILNLSKTGEKNTKKIPKKDENSIPKQTETQNKVTDQSVKQVEKEVKFSTQAQLSRVEEVSPEKSSPCNTSGNFMEFYRNASLQYLLHLSKTSLKLLKSKMKLNPEEEKEMHTSVTSCSSSEKENYANRKHESLKRTNSRTMWLSSLDECQHRRRRNSQWMSEREENKNEINNLALSEKKKEFSPIIVDDASNSKSSINSWSLNEESMNQFFNLANIVNIITPIKNTPVRQQSIGGITKGSTTTELVQLQKVCRKVLQSPSKK